MSTDTDTTEALPDSVLLMVAAQAPNMIPPWFKHEEPAKPSYPITDEVRAALTDAEARDLQRYQSTNVPPTEPRVVELVQQLSVHAAEKDAWPTLNEEAKYFQWRLYFAVQLHAHLAILDGPDGDGDEPTM